MEHYNKLEEHFADVTAFGQIDALLEWDAAVMMPEQGADLRARQKAVLGGKLHEMKADPKITAWMGRVDRSALNEWQQANLDLMARLHAEASAVPADLVQKKTLQESRTENIWRRARSENDFQIVLPELEKMVDIARDCGTAKAKALGVSPYEALMADFMPHMRSVEVDEIFDDLAGFLPTFLNEVLEKQATPLSLAGTYPQTVQEKLSQAVAESLGFDLKGGRIDASAHPFSTGAGGDVRITTRYDESDFISAMQAVAHETGHSLFDVHTPREWQQQPVGDSVNMGMAIHESQSLSVEMMLGRGLEYWTFVAPIVQKTLGVSGAAFEAENLFRQASHVSRGLIRVDADEVTYPAHVILRYRLEKSMIEGTLKVKDLPEAWNAGMQDLIGITPPDDALGCMQDIHWYCGAFGYFPAYAMGAVIAAQFSEKIKKDVPDLSAQLTAGNFYVFTNWLRDHVQSNGCLYTPPQLIERATGEKLSTTAFKTHLKERYLKEGAHA